MGQSFEDLLNELIAIRDGDYRSDPERNEARLRSLESIMQTVLEKLRDRFEP
jgi:hypothetical protein